MPLPINIDELIQGNLIESDRMDFKKGWNPEAVLHTICAFANDINNTGGGYIIIGIEEEDHVAKFPPAGLQTNQLEPIQKDLHRICHFLEPLYFPMVSPEVYQDKNILVIWVPPGDTRPYKAPVKIANKDIKKYYIRRLSSTIRANHTAELQLMELAAKITFDNRINQFASNDDINLTHVTTFLKEVNSTLYDQVTKISALDIYRSMDIVRGPQEFIRPVNAGLLLFADEPHKFFTGAQIDLIIYKDAVGDKFTEKIFQGPIHRQLRDVLAYIKSNIITEEVRKIEGIPESDRFYNYPYEAIEESIANAVYHKSYEDSRSIEINIRIDKIEILSYPGPLPPVTNEMLQRDHIAARTYRNSRIGDFLKELHLTEGRGTGIPKIRNLLRINGSPDPIFETDQDRSYFLTILKPHPDSVSDIGRHQEGAKKEPGTDQATDQVTDQVIKLIIVLRNNEYPTTILMEKLDLKHRPTFRENYINPSIEEGIIELTDPDSPRSPQQKYRLTEKGKKVLYELEMSS